jgi:hypothetical protein
MMLMSFHLPRPPQGFGRSRTSVNFTTPDYKTNKHRLVPLHIQNTAIPFELYKHHY